MSNELTVIHPEYNQYPDIIMVDEKNPIVRSPYSPVDLFFYQTRDTMNDSNDFRRFIKSAEARIRASREYKAYKAYLIETIGINRCQILGNVTMDDADIELHHNVLGLFDICLLITYHTINTVGCITTFDLIQMLIQEHYNNNVGVTFLSKTAHQVYTADPEGFIPPEMTFGKWWELLNKYKYGITYEIANKVIKYIKKYQDHFPMSINLPQQEQILSFANFNEYGTPLEDIGSLPGDSELNYENTMYTRGVEFQGF